MMRMIMGIAGLALVATSGTTAAQGWIGRLVGDEARAAIEAAARPASRRTPASPPPAPGTASGAISSAAGTAPAATVPPFPVRLEYPGSDDPRDLRFSQADKDAKAAFDDRSEVRCSDCEGLRTYEAWIRHQVPGLGRTDALEARIGALGVGGAIRWRGRATGTDYALTVTAAEPVGDFRCKQVRWTASKGADRAERPGLFCWFPRGEKWTEVL